MDKRLYSELNEILLSGTKAAVVSHYSAGKIEKKVYHEDRKEEKDALDALLACPEIRTYGPVSFLEQEPFTTIEQYAPKSRLIILGGGHIALSLVKMARLVDFSVVVFDDRPAFANGQRFPDADEVICDDFSQVFDKLTIRETDYVVIVTRGHKHDTECLEGVLRGKLPTYVGMIGSKRRVDIVLRELAAQGHSPEDVAAVHTPIGLKIGAITPAEIAVSILSEMIAVKRLNHGGYEDVISCDHEAIEWLSQYGDRADAVVTILETNGSVPREAGAKMVINYEGKIFGTIGGGCAEADMMQEARSIIRDHSWGIRKIDLTDSAEEDGMVCGGTMRVLIESNFITEEKRRS
ncbi:MAG: XdhC family protein [Clostridiales Family XIII bacterium]|jgi:xanthine dehydrogenase accessory factor|nr:XdhC family protein [Clostridiales Family XIII bacterium]